jgi:copper chaperone CopZ
MQMKTAKNTILLFLISAAVLLVAGTALAAERTAVLSVPDMECGSKEIQADMALTGLEGVSAVELDTDEKKATVTFDDEAVSIEDMERALAEFDMSVAGVTYPGEE